MKTLSTSAAAAFGIAALLLSACGDSMDPIAETTDVATDGAEDTTTEAPSDAEGTGTETDAAVEGEMAEPSVSFANIADGDTITTSFLAEFAAEGVTVAAAGEVVEGEGHFHVLVDVPCVAAGEVIPSDENHLHFGDGSTSATLELEVGEHTLCLQLADGVHTATDLTHTVTVTVA